MDQLVKRAVKTIQKVFNSNKIPSNTQQPYILKVGDAGDISPPIFWIFRQILGWARGTN